MRIYLFHGSSTPDIEQFKLSKVKTHREETKMEENIYAMYAFFCTEEVLLNEWEENLLAKTAVRYAKRWGGEKDYVYFASFDFEPGQVLSTKERTLTERDYQKIVEHFDVGPVEDWGIFTSDQHLYYALCKHFGYKEVNEFYVYNLGRTIILGSGSWGTAKILAPDLVKIITFSDKVKPF